MITQCIDSIPFRLKSPHAFPFLKDYGQVFKVFDDQDSGNICFGVRDGERRYFIKFAGAPTARAVCTPEDAIQALRAAIPAYRDLAHPNLIRFITDIATADGYAAVFDWADGECMGRMYDESHRRFMAMHTETKLRVFEDILDFHIHVAEHGYVAIDFYDGSVMYDFGRRKTVLCDIDFYTKRPYINKTGRMWGSSRFMSPEEHTLGATIDELTNVYCMGAMAFALFADCDRTAQAWPLNERLYAVARRATSDDRAHRQPTIRALLAEWAAAFEPQ